MRHQAEVKARRQHQILMMEMEAERDHRMENLLQKKRILIRTINLFLCCTSFDVFYVSLLSCYIALLCIMCLSFRLCVRWCS